MLDYAGIAELLPHGHPMLLVDRVEEFVPGESLVAVKAVTGCEQLFAGPGAGTAYPASLLIESFGQAAALLWLLSAPPEQRPKGHLPMFAAARNVLLTRPVTPGDVVVHRVRLDQTVYGTAFASGESRVGPDLAAVFGSMTAVIRPAEAVLFPRGQSAGEARQVSTSGRNTR
jgi:3-hydroxyacyl-[acyl-carrier-protein] dehydratase